MKVNIGTKQSVVDKFNPQPNEVVSAAEFNQIPLAINATDDALTALKGGATTESVYTLVQAVQSLLDALSTMNSALQNKMDKSAYDQDGDGVLDSEALPEQALSPEQFGIDATGNVIIDLAYLNARIDARITALNNPA